MKDQISIADCRENQRKRSGEAVTIVVVPSKTTNLEPKLAPMDGPRARRALVAVGLVGAGLAFALVGPPVCPTALFFGIPCPGCGLTRATLALLHGDFAAALRLHPLVFVLTPLFAYAVGVSLIDYVRGVPAAPARLAAWFSERARYGAALALLVVALGVWGARFAGYLGGPVPVESLRAVSERLHQER